MNQQYWLWMKTLCTAVDLSCLSMVVFTPWAGSSFFYSNFCFIITSPHLCRSLIHSLALNCKSSAHNLLFQLAVRFREHLLNVMYTLHHSTDGCVRWTCIAVKKNLPSHLFHIDWDCNVLHKPSDLLNCHSPDLPLCSEFSSPYVHNVISLSQTEVFSVWISLVQSSSINTLSQKARGI